MKPIILLKKEFNKFLSIDLNKYIICSLILSIYFSTFLTIIFSILVFLIWIISNQFTLSLNCLKQNPVILYGLLLLSYLAISILYSSATWHQSIIGLSKYRELLLLFILPAFFQSKLIRIKAWQTIVAASIITLLGSYSIYFGFFDYIQPDDPSIKNRITHSLLISFFAFYCLHKFTLQEKYKIVYCILFILSTYNLFFIVAGRTGQLNFILLMLLFCIQKLNKTKIVVALIILFVFLMSFMYFSDKAVRIIEGISETRNYLQSDVGETNTSMGLRLSFWKNALKMIADKPLFGHGTGSYVNHYGETIAQRGNPHNEFLMITVQLGLTGLLLFLAFLYSQYKHSLQLENENKFFAQGLLLSLISNSFFNSSFLDFTEGHWFAVMIALCSLTSPQLEKWPIKNLNSTL
jgi:O-antigen ligase